MSTKDFAAPHVLNIVNETIQAKPTKRQDGSLIKDPSNLAGGCGDLAGELCKILGLTKPGAIRSLNLNVDATDFVIIKIERYVTNQELADINDAISKSMLEPVTIYQTPFRQTDS